MNNDAFPNLTFLLATFNQTLYDSSFSETPRRQLRERVRLVLVFHPMVFLGTKTNHGSFATLRVSAQRFRVHFIFNAIPFLQATGIFGSPPIRPLETLHNALSLKQLDNFLDKMTNFMPASRSGNFDRQMSIQD